MHLRKFPVSVHLDIIEAFDSVLKKESWPSSRFMQFGGKAIERDNERGYNCAYTPIDRIEAFRDFMFLSLCGCGVGASVRSNHINLIPEFPIRGDEYELKVLHYAIEDTKEGWANAAYELFRSYLDNYKIEFNYSLIRDRGAELKTSGGKAPGHLPLKKSLDNVDRILSACSGRRMKSIEVYDICMHFVASVLSAGIRRAATIFLFSPDDAEMMNAKTGNWLLENPQRAYSNNSVALNRNTSTLEQFERCFKSQIEFGEPGSYFCDDDEQGSNPCLEIGLLATLIVDNENIDQLNKALIRQPHYQNFKRIDNVSLGQRLSGVQFCNLSMSNGAAVRSEDHFYDLCYYAAVIGTLQAAYADFPFLGPITEFLTRREALIGVSICGFFDNPKILLNPEILRKGAEIVKETNMELAAKIGINPAARTTCVKPDGTGALVLGSASGITPHHSKYYFRRVQSTKQGSVYQHFKATNPQMCESGFYSPTDDVITFPVQAPGGAILRKDIDAISHLNAIKLVQENWVIPGQAHTKYVSGHHNVSNTVTFQSPDTSLIGRIKEIFVTPEYKKIKKFIWDNRFTFTGIALLQQMGDKKYPQAPREEVTTAEDAEKWNKLNPVFVDWSELKEYTDNTQLQQNVACAGGVCELV